MARRLIYSPPDLQYLVALRDGQTTLLRPICSEDREDILAFHSRLSLDTKFLRFHYMKHKLTESDLEQYCDVDYYDSFAMVAEKQRSNGPEIVGVGRYVRLSPSSDCAEFAFVVEDAEQGNGIGTQLLLALIDIARERDITTFVAELLNENTIMMDILRKYRPELHQTIEGSSKNVTFSL